MQNIRYRTRMVTTARSVMASFFLLVLTSAVNSLASTHETRWVSARALMAGTRGFYPNAAAYAGTVPLGGSSAYGCGILTWVVDWPVDNTCYVWIRRYMGYGPIDIRIDEGEALRYTTALRANKRANNQYGWEELGRPEIASGVHHIDIQVHRPRNAILDVILLTTDPDFVPAIDGTNLPECNTNPILRASRNAYRDDSGLTALAGTSGFVVANLPALYGEPFEMSLNDFVPAPDQVIETLQLWSGRNQYATATFAVRALTEASVFQATISPLTGPEGTIIDTADLDLKVVKLIPRTLNLNWVSSAAPEPLPDLLLRDDRTSIPPTGHQGGFGGGACVSSLPAHQSRQFWLTVHVPASVIPGNYTGTISLAVDGAPDRTQMLPVSLTVEPIRLQTIEGLYGIFQRFKSSDLGTNRLLEVMHDHVRHGLNSTTLYGGYNDLKYAHQAGMTGYTVQMSWPSGPSAISQVAGARSLGFKDYLFYIKDEPSTQAAIDRAIEGLTSAHRLGVKGMVALNSTNAWGQLQELIDVPVHVLYHFHGAENAAVTAANARGFLPISYWMTNISDPLFYRAYTGLYNTRCGYQGSIPWAYADYSDDQCYSNTQSHVLSYADAYGMPISTIRWEAHKDGIDDVRYLQELDRLLVAARARQEQPNPPQALAGAIARAAAVRMAEYETIGGTYYHYLNQLASTQLDATRRTIAEAIMELNTPMAIDEAFTVDARESTNGILRGVDLDGDALTFRIVTNGLRGVAVITDPATGAFTYTAGRTPGVTDTITFQCSGGGVDSALATVTVTIRAWYHSDWQRRAKVTIDTTKVVGTLTNFPMLIDTTLPQWKSFALEGHVGQLNGADFLFTKADGETKLPHEIEAYAPDSGRLTAWVNVDVLASGEPTDLYVYYGNETCEAQWNVTGTWNSNFTMVQHFQEAPENNVRGFFDSTAHAYHGTAKGFGGTGDGTTDAPGKFDGAVRFDGNNYVTCGTGSQLRPATVTAEFWMFQPETAKMRGGRQTFISAQLAYWIYQHEANDYLYLYYWKTGGGYTGSYLGTSVKPAANRWHYVTVTFNTATKKAEYYLDGNFIQETTLTDVPGYSAGTCYIGCYNAGANYRMVGTIDEVRISNIVRSSAWIKTTYNSLNSPSTFYSLAKAEYYPVGMFLWLR